MAGCGVEKRRPTYDIEAIKRAIGRAETVSMTSSARRDAARMGFRRDEAAAVVGGTTRAMFYKSMTTYGDHRIWQDVYHVPAQGMVLYVKFQADVITEFSIVSFKER